MLDMSTPSKFQMYLPPFDLKAFKNPNIKILRHLRISTNLALHYLAAKVLLNIAFLVLQYHLDNIA